MEDINIVEDMYSNIKKYYEYKAQEIYTPKSDKNRNDESDMTESDMFDSEN